MNMKRRYGSEPMEMPVHTRILLALLAAVLITACGTTKLSTRELSDVEAGRKAIVRTYNQPLLGAMLVEDMPVTQILTVDGRKMESTLKLDEQVALDVGPHEIEFACVDRSGNNENDFTEVIRMDLKPHHEYLVRCSFDSRYGADGSYAGGFGIKEQRIK
jgi:hypothetical protein